MRAGLGRCRFFVAVASCLILLPAFVSAAEVDRDSYREAVEPICKENTKANERIFRGVKAEVKHNHFRLAAARFDRAARALKGTLTQLKAVPQPAEDKGKLAKWLGDVEVEAQLFGKVAGYLRAGKKTSAERTVVRLESNASRANNVVIVFEFHYCRLEPSRFT